jgi:hypothetical protein
MKNITKLLVAGLLALGVAKGLEIGVGGQYASSKVSPMVTVSETYKAGKVIVGTKAEKVIGSPIALQLTGIYPLPKDFSASIYEKIGVDSEIEPTYYQTGVGLGKKLGNTSVSIGASMTKPNEKPINWSFSASGSYKFGNATVSALGIFPEKTPTKPIVKACLSYRL